MPHKAPLRESLAAGMMMATGYDGSQNLVLPMCGSGTLAIEAALIAMNRPAGGLRSNYGFKHVKVFDPKLWEEIRDDAGKNIRRNAVTGRIIATDIDPQAIAAAKQNAQTAGVDHLIEFGVCDFAETQVPQDGGIIVMNPEYGLRLGESSELEAVYKRIGEFLKKQCSGYTAYVLSGNKDLTIKLGLKASRRIVFFNGNIECRLLKYELYEGSR